MRESILANKRILAVDDEPDVLDALEEQLEDYPGLLFDKATDYETAYHLLRSWTYDLVILDIMGVRGFDLLEIANRRMQLRRTRELYCPHGHETRLASEDQRLVDALEAVSRLALAAA